MVCKKRIVSGNLGMQKKIEDWEVITDVPHIRSLSNMHESLEWFCASVRRTLAQLPSSAQERLRQAQVEVSTSDSDRPPEIETLSVGLEKRLNALDEMAGTCLLMLHLEVRVHCFYHLLPLARQGSHVIGASQSQEADPRILALNRDLVQLHELLGAQLQPRKVRYVFEGLGHLVSVIFIHSSQHIQKINDNGKKRMCRNIFSLQQCLSALTSNREPDLDTARKFFEMLYTSPDEIIDGIVGRGPKFSEIEYTFLLSLAVRSHPTHSSEPGALDSRLSRLREVMSERRK
jgi:exocyst complex component 4